MENNILRKATTAATAPPARSRAAGHAVDRSLARRRAAAEDEVTRLIDAAFRVIERTGHLEPRVADILAEAGLSNPAFYRHFSGKHELLVAVLDEGIQGLADHLASRTHAAAAPEEAVRAWIRGMAAQALRPDAARASRPFALARGRLAESFPKEVAESERRVTAPLRRALEAAREAGAMPDVVPDVEAEAIYHLMMGWVEARLVDGRLPDPQEIDALEAFVIAGLSRSASDTPRGAACESTPEAEESAT